MREIKFRVWDKENKEMLDVQELDYQDSYNGQPMIRTTMYNDYFDTEDMILMQYTGLKDIDNEEVYCGDILFWNTYNCKGELIETRRYEVVEDIDGWKLKNHKNERKTRSISWIPHMKKVGNIYKNPSLLKEEI